MPAGTVICQEGTPAESMFIIANGSIEVCTTDKKGQRLQLATLSPGDFFGEVGLFTRQPRMASCEATEEVELLEIKRTDFDGIVKRFPRVKEALHNFYKARVLDTILAKSELFGALKPDVRGELARRFSVEEIVAGKNIVKEGDDGDCLFVIRDGSVEVVTNKGGKEVLLATLGPGDFFGEVALISNKKRTASIRAKTAAVVMKLSRKDFQWALEKAPQMLAIAKAYVEKRVEDTIKAMR
jgi:cAMP-dependent protein kinase regulator